jgi:hypothetical protein
MLLANLVMCMEKSSTVLPSWKWISENYFLNCLTFASPLHNRCDLIASHADCVVRLVERVASISRDIARRTVANVSRSF